MTRFDPPIAVQAVQVETIDPVSRIEPIGVPFSRLGQVLRRRAWVILLCVGIGVAASGAIVLQMPPRYTAAVSVLVEPRRTQVSDLQAISTEPENVPNMIKTQIDILRSPALASRVVQALDLTNVEEFRPQPGWLASLLRLAAEELGLTRGPDAPAAPSDELGTATEQLLAQTYFGNEPRSNVLRIFSETGDPDLSARISNEFARQFLEFKRHQKFAATQRAHEWFQERLRELSVNVRAAEQQVQAYRERHGLTDVPTSRGSAPTGPSVNTQQLADISRRYIAVLGERARKTSQLEQAEAVLRDRGRPDSLPEVIQSPLIQRLREQEAAAAGRETQLAATIGERSPDLLQARAQRQGLQRRIQEEMANIVLALRSEVRAALAEEEAVREKLTLLRASVSAENTAEVRLHGLLAEAQASRSIYESFLSRATQLANVAGIQEPDAELVSPAVPPPRPSAPKKARLLIVAGMLSLVVGLAIAFLLERLKTGYASPEEAEADLGIAAMGIIPSVALSRRRMAPSGKGALELTAALSKIRGGLQVLEEARRPKVIMVTSAVPKEGKSVFALSLAHSAARAGWRTLLLDCDMRRPSVAARLDLTAENGLHRVLTTEATSLQEGVVHRLPRSGLHVMPTSESSRSPQDLLASLRMARLLELARKEYDLVVIDAPPVLPVADTLVLGRQVDATLFAVQWEKTPRPAARSALRLLQGSGARVIGVVLTQVNMRSYVSGAPGVTAYVHRKFDGYYSSAA